MCDTPEGDMCHKTKQLTVSGWRHPDDRAAFPARREPACVAEAPSEAEGGAQGEPAWNSHTLCKSQSDPSNAFPATIRQPLLYGLGTTARASTEYPLSAARSSTAVTT